MDSIAADFGAGAGQLAVVLFPLLFAVAGVGDVMTRRIPNRLILFTAMLFLPLALLAGMPAWMVGGHVLTAMALLAFGYCLFLAGALGGGDAKMMAVAGLWLGYPSSIYFAGFSVLTGGVLAVAFGGWYLARRRSSVHGGRPGQPPGPPAPNVPYGLALAAGAIFAMPLSWWMQAAAS